MDDLEIFINQFTGGISSDEYLTPDGACFDMENIDINHSSLCLTATKCNTGVINARRNGRTIAVSPFGNEWASYDGIIEDSVARGGDVIPGEERRPCLFCMPQLGPKLINSSGRTVVGFSREKYISNAVRGNASSKPFWLIASNKVFSLVNPDALREAMDEDNRMSSLSDFQLEAGWEITSSAIYPNIDVIQHEGGTGKITLVRPNQYGTYSGDSGETTTNYQLFWFGVVGQTKGRLSIDVSAPIATYRWNTSTGKYEYEDTSTKSADFDDIRVGSGDSAYYCFAINGLDGNATWTITPTDDFDGEIFLGGLINAENFLTTDGENGNAEIALDNCRIDQLGPTGTGVDTTDLQEKVVITPGKGGFVAGSGKYVAILNTRIESYNFQISPYLDMILPTSYEVMAITVYADQITIYANNSGNGYQMVWDGASLYPQYTYTWEGQTFETVISSMGYDYVTVRSARDTMQYYVVNGPQRSLIGGSDYFNTRITGADSRMEKEESRMLTQRDDDPVWGKLGMMRCGQPVFASLGGDLLVYGTKKAGFGNAWYKPLSLGFAGTNSDVDTYTKIDCLGNAYGSGIGIYYTNGQGEHCYKNLIKGHWSGDNFYQDDYWNQWFSYTLNPIIGSHFTEKEIDKLFISYRLPNDKWKINLYAKVDDDMYWRVKPRGEVQISKGDVYFIGQYADEYSTRLEFIKEIDGWLEFRRIGPMYEIYDGGTTLTREKGEGDESIRVIGIDNWIKVGELGYNGFDHNYENLLNTQVYGHFPFFHKIQFKIEGENLETKRGYAYNQPPEIYNIYIPFKQHTIG